jgi:hypothetical protein
MYAITNILNITNITAMSAIADILDIDRQDLRSRDITLPPIFNTVENH